MKKIKLTAVLLSLVCLYSACSVSIETKETTAAETTTATTTTATETSVTEVELMESQKPNITQIRSICKLATLSCYYHDVAKSVKEAGTGIWHKGEKDRKFWTEYTGVAKIGVDMSKGHMEIEDKTKTVTIYIPEAEILSIKVDETSVADPIVEGDDSILWYKNEISADDITGAVKDAQDDITAQIQNNSTILVNAQDRAKELIENYIVRLGQATDVKYKIVWKDASEWKAS